MISQIVFILLTIGAFGYAFVQYNKIRKNIMMGASAGPFKNTAERWRNMLLIAFGQKKMFRRPIPAILHLFIYVAFVITQIELIEIMVDGFFGTHRFFAHSLGGFYIFIISLIEVLSVLAFIGTLIFLARRNLLKIPRFFSAEMKGWPFKDGNLILLFEILLIVGIFSMNGADTVLQDKDPAHFGKTGAFAISSWLGPMLFGRIESVDTLHVIERFGWWLHIIMVFVFLNYLPKSKHLHVLFAFPNTWYAPLRPNGEMENMPDIMNEVKSMMGLTEGGAEMPMDEEIPEFGVKDVFDLKWTQLLAAYTCTECGRCTSECPANITGKKLSPRKVMMDVRDRVEDVAEKIRSGNKDYCQNPDKALSASNFDDGKTLLDFITPEEIHACTTCNACVEACPVLIRPMDVILDLRRYEILTLSQGPADWLPMFNSMENSGAAWAMTEERSAWVNE